MNKPPSDRTVEGVGLWPLACWGYGFEFLRGHGSLRQADHSSRGVLPTVVRRCVRSTSLINGRS